MRDVFGYKLNLRSLESLKGDSYKSEKHQLDSRIVVQMINIEKQKHL